MARAPGVKVAPAAAGRGHLHDLVDRAVAARAGGARHLAVALRPLAVDGGGDLLGHLAVAVRAGEEGARGGAGLQRLEPLHQRAVGAVERRELVRPGRLVAGVAIGAAEGAVHRLRELGGPDARLARLRRHVAVEASLVGVGRGRLGGSVGRGGGHRERQEQREEEGRRAHRSVGGPRAGRVPKRRRINVRNSKALRWIRSGLRAGLAFTGGGRKRKCGPGVSSGTARLPESPQGTL